MTNQKILAGAVEKARDNGLTIDYSSKKDVTIYADGYKIIPIEYVIFNHDFAKALWGEELYCRDCRDIIGDKDEGPAEHDVVPLWQHCLQQMVIAEDPIKYLGDNL